VADQSEFRIKEYGSLLQPIIDEAFVKYAEVKLTKWYGEDLDKWPISLTRTSEGSTVVNHSSIAGIISFHQTRLVFEPKVEANVYFMMLSSGTNRSLRIDPKELIDVEAGDSFQEILAGVFLTELQEILNHGLLRRYVLREENLPFLKGKLLVNENNRANLGIKPRFYCSYHDLTFDNLENKIVLRALNLIIPLVRKNDNLKSELIRIQRLILEEVELDTSIGPSDCFRVHLDRLSFHYEKAIMISKIVLEDSFVRSTDKGSSKGFNFLIDMNKLFEDFLTEMTQQVLSEKSRNLKAYAQSKLRTLDREGELTIIPDILICDSKNKTYPLILDAKYKTGEVRNADAYQMIAYSLAVPSTKVACLVYPFTGEPKEMSDILYVRRNLTESEVKNYLPLLIRFIDLSTKKKEDNETFLKRVKDQIWGILREMMKMSGMSYIEDKIVDNNMEEAHV
jgi:5-methylcytosine-specific restriction enzyme subunit McrC